MSRFLSIILLFLSIGIVAKSQNITPVSISHFNSSAYNGKVKIKQDAKLKNFVETSVGLNKKRNGFYGYRVKIYAENHPNARSQANTVRTGFRQDGEKAYLNFIEPNFEVLVGDFTNRFDAVKLLKKINTKYPNAYVVKTIVSYPNH
ncbi:MAG: SPOR domain-containing protein [Bacteroidales bacterium]